MRDVYLLKEEH